MPITAKDAPGTLPAHGKEIFVAAWNSAYGGTCKDRSDKDECASKIAWSAVKNKYKKDGDKWVRKAGLEEGLVEVSMTITKASVQSDGSLRWQCVASDTGRDSTGQCTSLTLFQDWITRAETGQGVPFLPPPRKPFLGVSHYPSLDGLGEAGITERMWVDGNRFKADGHFLIGDDHPLGKALFEAIKNELDLIKRGQTIPQPIRISAAWWDLEHSHGSFVFTRRSLTDMCPMCAQGDGGNAQFLKGQLDHFASTRVPVHPRTELGLEEKSMAKVTRKQDAVSIIGEEKADELEQQARLVGKSEAEEDAPAALVVKANEEPDVEQMMDGMGEEHEYRPLGGATSLADADSYIQAQEMMDKLYTNWDVFRIVVSNILNAPDGTDQQAALSQAVKEFGDRVDSLKANVTDAYLVALANVVSPAPAAEPAIVTEAEKGANIMPDTTTTQEAQIVAPANSPEAVLSTAIKASLENPQLTREAKSQAIQDALNSYVITVKAQLDAVAPLAPGEEVAAAIERSMGKFSEKLDLLVAKLDARPAQPVAVPQQKSYVPGPVTQQAQAQQTPLRAMIRRSVGIVE